MRNPTIWRVFFHGIEFKKKTDLVPLILTVVLFLDHLSTIGYNIGSLLPNYENFFLITNLNVERHNGFLQEFCDLYNVKNLIKVPTCFKNLDFPTNIRAMSTTSYGRFHNQCVIETGLSDFRKIIVTVMQTYFQRKEPKIIQYWGYSKFSAAQYQQYILKLLSIPRSN